VLPLGDDATDSRMRTVQHRASTDSRMQTVQHRASTDSHMQTVQHRAYGLEINDVIKVLK
jgi:hypothetical protein